MNFLQKIFGSSFAKPDKRYYTFFVKCKRCGETIEGRVDLDNELSVEYEDDGNTYFVRKVLMGENRCFQRIEVELKFTSKRELIERQVIGGELVS
jgi:translation initiation factor 2 beta subunit (eIF-2beta)/eIF-5